MDLSLFSLFILSAFVRALFHPIFWIVCVLVVVQYYRISQMEEKLFGRSYNNFPVQVLLSLALGVGGGLLASILLILFGLSLDKIGIIFIWPVAILLLLIHPRFLCFAYAGGIVALAVLITRGLTLLIPSLGEIFILSHLINIHLPGLLVLIAVLHLTESLLIFVGGHWGSSPVYLKNTDGEVVGGFSLQRFWPVPLVGMILELQSEVPSFVTGITMPDWWPILQPGFDLTGPAQIICYLLPVAAGLGYADLALTSTPREKSYISAKYLFYYSMLLLLLALASVFSPLFIVFGVLFAPLGHELVVYLGGRMEFSRKPYYKNPADSGVMILTVFPGSSAQKAGLQEGDIIKKVNGEDVENGNHFRTLIKESYFMTYLHVERARRMLSLVLKMKPSDRKMGLSGTPEDFPPRQPLLGLILVPDTKTPVYVELKRSNRGERIRNLFIRKK